MHGQQYANKQVPQLLKQLHKSLCHIGWLNLGSGPYYYYAITTLTAGGCYIYGCCCYCGYYWGYCIGGYYYYYGAIGLGG